MKKKKSISANEYEQKILKSYLKNKYRNLNLEKFAIEKMKPKIKERIVDIGCGTGTLLLSLKEKGFNALGIDYSKKCLLEAKSLGLNVKYGNATNLPIEDKSVDKIFLLGVVGYLNEEDLNICFLEIKRVLKPNGKVLIRMGQPLNAIWNSILKLYKIFKKEEYESISYIHNPLKITDLLERNNMKIKIFLDPIEPINNFGSIIKLLFYPFITGIWILGEYEDKK